MILTERTVAQMLLHPLSHSSPKELLCPEGFDLCPHWRGSVSFCLKTLLSQEVWALRDTRNTEVEQDSQSLGKEREEAVEESQGSFAPHVCVPGERPLCFGEILLAEFSRKRRLEFRKMFQLKEGLKLHSNWGLIAHKDMEGRPAGSVIRTSMGIPIVIRRPGLDEFTLFMKRGPAIAYPKVRNKHHKTAVSHLHINEPVTSALLSCRSMT